MTDAYSLSWFSTFADSLPPDATAADVAAIVRFAPPAGYRRLLDVGCGTGRVAGPLAASGYRVTGLDTNVDALRRAAGAVPGATFVALDQCHVGQLRWTFDVVVVLWNSFGFGSRSGDLETLRGIRRTLRPGGRLLLDLYHPAWLAARPQGEQVDRRGVVVRRWVQDGRCMHEIRYPGGGVDRMSFNVYTPAETVAALAACDYVVPTLMTRWDPGASVSAEYARYQVVAERPAL